MLPKKMEFRDYYAVMLLVVAVYMWTRSENQITKDVLLLVAGGLLAKIGDIVQFYFRKKGDVTPPAA